MYFLNLTANKEHGDLSVKKSKLWLGSEEDKV